MTKTVSPMTTKQIERALGAALRQVAPADCIAPRKPITDRSVVVIFSVRRKDGGVPFRWNYTAKPGTWATTAKHEARQAMRRAGLVEHAWIDTVEPA